MGMWLRQSTASQEILLGKFVDSTDAVTAETALSIANTDIQIWKEGATTLANKNSGGATHISGGLYYAVLDATDTDTLGKLEVNVAVTGALAVRREFMVLPAMVYDSMVLGTDTLQADVTQWLGTAAATPDTAGHPKVTIKDGTGAGEIALTSGAVDSVTTVATLTGHTPQTGDSYARLGAPAGASVSADIAAAKADTAAILLDTGTDGVVVAAGSKTGYSLASTGLDAIVSTATGVVEVAKGVWDRVLSAANHNIANSAGRRLRGLASQIVEDGTAQAGATASITLAAGASSVDNYYNLDVISIVDGTGAGQSRMVLAYNGTTKVATVYRDWAVNPDNTSVYVINAKTELLVRNSGLAAGGAANSITLSSTASSVNDNYVGETIVIAAGTGASQARVITAYNGTTKVATVTDAWATTPDTSSVYALLPLGRAYVIDLDADSLAKINAEVDTALADYDPPTRTEATSDANSILTRLGTPAGADVSTDIAAVKAETSAIVADTNELQTDLVNGGRLDLLIDAIKAKTDNLPAAPAATGDIPTVSDIWTTALTEAYRSTGATGTAAQLLYELLANITEFTISGTTKTAKKLDGSTTAKTYTLNDGTSPTGITETT